MELFRILQINSIKMTRWERMIGQPYRKQRKQLLSRIRDGQFDAVMTSPSIAWALGNLGIPYLYRHRLRYQRGGIRRNARKDWHLAVLDDGSDETEDMLLRVCEDFNYLSVVTDREEHFAYLEEIVYEETGLVLQVVSQIPRKANIILDLKP